MQTLEYKCPCCTAPLVFKSESQKLECEYCLNSFTLEQLEALEAAEQKKEEPHLHWNEREDQENADWENVQTYVCSSCGAEIVSDENTAAIECLFCGNPVILQGRVSGRFRPDYVIPFQMNKEQAKEALRRFYKGKALLPRSFSTENQIDKITGIYVPYWLFDCDAAGSMDFKGTRVSSWSDSKYRYTKTDHYLISRSGCVGFDKLPVDGSKKMDDTYMEAIEPFRYDQLMPFESGYLSGYLADKYDVEAEESKGRADQRITNSFEQLLRSTVSGYTSVLPAGKDVRLENGSYKYALLPVWMLNTKYRGASYTFAMNGQTGKLVGRLPMSWGRFWGWFAGLTAGIGLLGELVLLLIGG